MSDFKILKCPSCGSSMVETETETLIKCSHCGSQLMAKQPGILPNKINSGQITKLLYLVIFLLLVIAAVFFWFSFNQKPISSQPKMKQDLIGIQKPQPNQIVKSRPSSIPTMQKSDNAITNESAKKSEVPIEKPVITIISSFEAETSIGGKYWIVTIRNDSPKSVVRPRVIMSLFDQDNRRIGEHVGWAKQDTLSKGEETAVLVLISKPPKDSYTNKMEAMATYSQFITSNLENINVDDFIVNDDAYNKYAIIGDVTNQNDFRVDYIWVQAIAKNENGKVVGLADAFVTHSSLAGKEKSGFKISAGTFIAQTPTTWTLVAKGRKHRGKN